MYKCIPNPSANFTLDIHTHSNITDGLQYNWDINLLNCLTNLFSRTNQHEAGCTRFLAHGHNGDGWIWTHDWPSILGSESRHATHYITLYCSTRHYGALHVNLTTSKKMFEKKTQKKECSIFPKKGFFLFLFWGLLRSWASLDLAASTD